jgi:hypothetical protein
MAPAQSDLKPWDELIRKLRALPEPAMRREVLIEQFGRMDPPQVLALLPALRRGMARRRPACLDVLGAVHEAILSAHQQAPLYELLAEVYRLAREAGEESVARLLIIARPQRGPLPAKDVPGDLEMSRLALGQRKYLARGHNRLKLDRLLYDPEPAVLRNLLRNPSLVEQDVIRLAARRPARDEIQRVIHGSRWCARYRVKLALCCNPYTPTEIALKLLGFLQRRDLLMIKRDEGLHPLVREEARHLLGRAPVTADDPA